MATPPTPVGPTFPTNAPVAISPALPVATAQWALAQAAPGVPLRFTFSEGIPEDATPTAGPTLPALTELLSVPRPKMDVPLPADQVFRAMIGTATRTETPSNTAPVSLSTSPVQPLATATVSEQTVPASEVTPSNLPTAALPVTQTRVGDPAPSLTMPEPTFVAMIPTRPAPENQPMAVTILQSAFPTAVSPQSKPKDTESPTPVLTDFPTTSLDSAPSKSLPTVIAEPLPKAFSPGSRPASPGISAEPALRGIASALPQPDDPATPAILPMAQSLPTAGLDLPTSKAFSAALANLNVPQSETRPEVPKFSLPLPIPAQADSFGAAKVSVEPARSAHQEARPAPPPAREPASASPPPPSKTGTPEPAPTRVLAVTETATVGAKTSLAGETSFALHGSATTAGWSPVGLTPAARGMESTPTALPNTTFAQVEAGIHWLIKNQEKGAEIQLNPESLGRVVIKIVVEGGEVHARLWAAEPGTVTLLQNQKASLEVSLQQQGLSLGSFDLQQGRRGHDTPTAPQQAHFDSGAKFADSLSGKQEVPTRPLPLLDGTRLIEVFA
ncbi:MAG: flagellar hook-length control protein FliK [Holophaga sp.]|nr:flagellar hook-length control protein FliK [Holophaga sp.]